MNQFRNSDIRKGKKTYDYYMCCPFCIKKGLSPDENFHLGFNTQKGVFHCFRCEEVGSIKDVQELLILADSDTHDDLKELEDSIEELFTFSNQTTFNLDEISWKLSEKETPIAWNYMLNVRKFSIQEIEKHQLRVGKPYWDDKREKTIYKWCGRVLFPSISHNECNFIVGRAYTNKQPKYLNSTGSKSSVVYGLNGIKNECILCEGIISAIAAERVTGIPAISCLGKSGSFVQLSKIRSKIDKIYLSLDGTKDVIEDVWIKFNRQLIKMGFEVWNIRILEDKDPDDLGIEYLKYFKQAKKVSFI